MGQSGQAEVFSVPLRTAPQQLLCSPAQREGAPDRDSAWPLGLCPLLTLSPPSPGSLSPVPTLPWCLLTDWDQTTWDTQAQESRCPHGVPDLAYFVQDRLGGGGQLSGMWVVAGMGGSQYWAWTLGSTVLLTLAGFGTCGMMALLNPIHPAPHTVPLETAPGTQGLMSSL